MDGYRLFVDLDGVLVDFDHGVAALFGGRDAESIEPRILWPVLARTHGFYEHLPWMQDGRLLWDFVRPHQPVILTGLPRGNWAEPQKRAWCARELGTDVDVITCLSRDKAKSAIPTVPEGCIPVLIDDRLSLMESWEGLGGTFIFHENAKRSIERLRELGFQDLCRT